jgi:hypothetical protein
VAPEPTRNKGSTWPRDNANADIRLVQVPVKPACIANRRFSRLARFHAAPVRWKRGEPLCEQVARTGVAAISIHRINRPYERLVRLSRGGHRHTQEATWHRLLLPAAVVKQCSVQLQCTPPCGPCLDRRGRCCPSAIRCATRRILSPLRSRPSWLQGQNGIEELSRLTGVVSVLDNGTQER